MEDGTTKNLALIGYGKMGRLIEQLSPEYGFHVMLRLDEHDNDGGQGSASSYAAASGALTPVLPMSRFGRGLPYSVALSSRS